MNALVIAVALASAAAATHATAAVVQERLAARSAPIRPGDPERPLLANVLRRRQWWIAVALAATAALMQVVALRHGPLTVVQPLGALSLVLALPLRAAIVRHRVSATEWRGAALTVAGLAALLMLTASGRPSDTLRVSEIVGLIAVTVIVAVALAARALVTRGLVARSVLYAVAAGVTFAAASALTQTVVVRYADHGLAAVFGPAAVAVPVLAISGLLLAQAAYQGGLGAPLATLTLVNPAAAVVIGVVLLGERFVGGAVGAGLALMAGLVATSGIVLLARPESVRADAWAPARLGVR